MEHIEFHCFHGIQIAFESLYGLEVAGNVNQKPAPGEARTIFNDEAGRRESLRAHLYQLKKSLQAAENSQRVRRLQLHVG